MTSSSRNSRKPQALRLAIAAALLCGSVAQADQPSKFVLTAYTSDAGGSKLVKGDYDAAFDEIHRQPKGSASDAAALKNNECVALAMTGQFESALDACSAAIATAHRDLYTVSGVDLWERQKYSDYLAVAYSNRAVIYWLERDSVSAARDLATASALAPKADYVERNISALHDPHENAVAQVSMAPKS